MKLYVKASISPNIFDTSTTGMSYYDNFLNEKDLAYMQQAKNLTGEIVMMSPKEYYERCSRDIFNGRSSVKDLKQSRESSKFKDNTSFIDKYKSLMQSGTKFPLCTLNYANPTQEGLHRMYAAGELYGWNTKFPVLVVEDFDKEKAERWRNLDKLNDFERYDFKDICEDAIGNLIDKYYGNGVPDNVLDLIAEEVEAAAKSKGYDLKVRVEEQDLDGEIQYLVKIESFNNFINPNVDCEEAPFKYWESSLWADLNFDEKSEMTSEEARKLADDYDIDLSDDILSLFFKP